MQITHQSPSSLPLLNGSFVASCQGGGPQKYVTQAGHIALELTVHASLHRPQQEKWGLFVDTESASVPSACDTLVALLFFFLVGDVTTTVASSVDTLKRGPVLAAGEEKRARPRRPHVSNAKMNLFVTGTDE